jgi:uncharacterized membrane protein
MDHSTATARVDTLGTTSTPRQTSPGARVIIALDRGIYWVARHWLFAVNLVFCAHFVSLVIGPALVSWGYAGLARPIYGFNGLFCHQRDDRSFTLFGEKMPCCERCAAIYGSIALVGLLFALAHGRVRAPHISEVALLSIPLIFDGAAQLVGLWESTPATRVMTGVIFGVAICWLLLPYLDTGFARMRRQIESLFTRLVAEGRARPLRGAEHPGGAQ